MKGLLAQIREQKVEPISLPTEFSEFIIDEFSKLFHNTCKSKFDRKAIGVYSASELERMYKSFGKTWFIAFLENTEVHTGSDGLKFIESLKL